MVAVRLEVLLEDIVVDIGCGDYLNVFRGCIFVVKPGDDKAPVAEPQQRLSLGIVLACSKCAVESSH